VGVEHAVAQQHVAPVVQVVEVWNVAVFVPEQHLSDEDAYPDAALDLGEPEADLLSCSDGQRVVGEGEALVGEGRPCLDRIPACHIDTVSFESGTVDDEELELEDRADALIELIQSFYAAVAGMMFMALALFSLLAEKWTDSAFLSNADLENGSFSFASYSFKGIADGCHLACFVINLSKLYLSDKFII
jgi:hypothetical protein